MAKRDNRTTQTSGSTTATKASRAQTAGPMDQRVVAFAEQIGRIAGTLSARAETLMDRAALNKQIASVRDGAADLLEQLAGGAATTEQKMPAAAAPGALGRSGGMVDAPGKKHRKPMPADPGANIVDSQAAKMRTAKTMVKTNKRRGRG